jgi:hypothetical protein
MTKKKALGIVCGPPEGLSLNLPAETAETYETT